ncbi:MAG: hypothetical protein FJZ43_04105 [Candidatus Staskawiczbacteria bacterium]|nr:hypothetical protein [Candidatus Staskawiczbacteria bacterium]
MKATFKPDEFQKGVLELENLINRAIDIRSIRPNVTGRMLGASSEAAAAVAGGVSKSSFLRDAAAALTIFKGRL